MYSFRNWTETGQVGTVLKTTFNDVILDDVLTQNGTIFQTLAVNGRGLLSVEAQTVDIPGRHGRFFKGYTYGVRELTVTVRLKADNKVDFRVLFETLNRLLRTSEPAFLDFSDEPNRHYRGQFVKATEPDESSNDVFLALTFVGYDPFKYGAKQRVTTATISYQGDEVSFPLITLTLAEASRELRLLHVESQQYVRLRGTYQAGNKIVIDMKKRYVTQNGRSILGDLDMVNSRFFAFTKGTNTLSCNVRGTFISEFREVYL